MEMHKSSRHSSITGRFAEYLVMYWLSKYGFECVYVDHVGIDIIAYCSGQGLGISVKSRSRSPGRGRDSLSIPHADFRKMDEACKVFGCKPYFAIVIDADSQLRIFLMPKETLEQVTTRTENTREWKMTEAALQN